MPESETAASETIQMSRMQPFDLAPKGFFELKDLPQAIAEHRRSKNMEKQFMAIREEYRKKMNAEEDAAIRAASNEDMRACSEHSTASERYREAFHALNRVSVIVFKAIDVAEEQESGAYPARQRRNERPDDH